MKSIAWAALIVSIITYSFWGYLPKGSFYLGNALLIFLLCTCLFLVNRNSFVFYLLTCYSFNNLLDELFFDPKVLSINEKTFAVAVVIIWILKTKRNARENITK